MKSLTAKTSYTVLLFFLFLQFTVSSQVYCSGDTPFFSVDLTGNPTGTWVSPAVVRDGTCCGGGSHQVNCIEMAITLDPSAIGINFAVASGANPGGSLYFQINCQDVPVPTSGAPICLTGPGPHYISYCKVGNNTNTYSITSIQGPQATTNITTTENCSKTLSVTGLDPASVTWNSISPGAPGQYNSYLSNTSGSASVNVVPAVGAPATIQYTVCGNVVSSCLTQAFCDTVTVNILPVLDVAITPAAPYLCYGQSSVMLTANHTGGLAPYTYLWSNGQTTPSINVTTGGTYSVTVSDASGCQVATDQVTVVQYTQPITANAGSDLTACTAASSNIAVTGTVGGAASGIWSGGSGTYTTSPTDLSLNYTPTAGEIAAGSVTLTLTTTNTGSCPPVSDPMTITFAEMTAGVASLQHLNCFGGMNGAATISASGPGLPYAYSLNGGTPQASNTFTNLAAGNYSVVVTNSAGCSATVNFTITAPPQLTFSSVAQPVTCFGSCNGQIAVSPAGGTLPYTYSSNNGTTFGPANVLTGLCAGAIGVVVQDANGCLTNSTVVITQPTAITATFVQTNPICAGSCNGQITVSPSGGTAPYQYSANGGPLQSGTTLTGLCAGNQTILIQDANGCQVTYVRTLTDPPGYGIDLVSMSPSNCGFNNGAIEVAANGANGPFTYTINGSAPQPSGAFTLLVGGAYNFVATDALGCQAQAFFGINDVEMDGILLGQGNVTCYNGNDGWVNVINTDGADPITFDLDNAGVTQTNGGFDSLSAGSHIVTIYDAGLCVFTIPFTTTQPALIQFTPAVTHVTCNGGSNGTIAINGVTGGTGAYSYSMDGITFQPANTFSGLAAGTYTVYVSDANNCVVSGTATITGPSPVAFTSNAIDLTCFGDNSGFILLDGSGGQGGAYQYSITNGASFQTDPFFFNLAAGTYSIVVQDVAGCTAAGTIILTEPAALTAGLTALDVNCPGVCDGSVTVAPSGGTSPYFYSVDNGVTLLVNPVIGSLCSATYSVQTIDDNGCELTSTVTVGSPPALSLNTVLTPSTCDLPNGSVTAAAGGGTSGYTYSIDNVTFGPGDTFANLGSGAYTVYAQDAQGCTISAPVIVSSQPSPAITGIAAIHASCNAVCDGSVTMTASGGTGTVLYSIGGPFQASGTFTNLCAGSYALSISDSNGCLTGYGAPFVLTEPAVLTFTTDQTELTCFGNGTGTIDFQALGGTMPYQYSISNGGSMSSSSFFTLLDAGTYDLLVEDAHGCTATGQVILTQPPLLEIIDLQTSDALCFETCNGTATVSAQGGTVTAPYTYNWYTVATSVNNPQIGDLCAGSYTSVVLDQNGCHDTVQFTIAEPAQMVVDSIVATNVLCNGACDGTITVWASTAALYSFDGGLTYVPDNTMTGLCQGSYDVIAQSPDGCLTSVASVVLTDPPLLSVVAGPDSTLCAGTAGMLYALASGGTAPYTYYWDNENQGPALIVVPLASTSYDIYVQDANGCLSNLDSTLLSLYQNLTTAVPGDTVICPDASLEMTVNVLTGVPGYSHTWYANGASIAATAEVTVAPDTPTSYVVVTSDQCTTVSDTVNVSTFVLPDPVFEVSEPTGCIPMEITLYPTIDPQLLNGNCTWTFSDGTVVNGCDTITAVFSDPGCYSVTFAGETVNGCSVDGYSENVFCVVPNPQAEFTYGPDPTYISPEVQFQNLSTNADSYNWTFSGYASSQEEDPAMSFGNTDAGGTITVCLTATNLLGCSDQVCLPIVIGDEFAFYVPNAFTPDDDIHNQVFAPVFPDNFNLVDYELLIFNRWGEILFESHDPEVGWSGMYADKPAQDGIYTWKITVRDVRTNRLYDMIGHVTLIR